MWVQELVSNDLWAVIEPELPRPRRRAKWRGGRPRAGSGVLGGDHLRLEDGSPVGVLTTGDGLWLRHDVPASPAGVAASRCAASDLARAAGPARRSGRD